MRTFVKLQGLGNDFILLDHRTQGGLPETSEVIRLCDRRRGIGADGVLTLLPSNEGADAKLKIQNSDGSQPQMCGNGLRCVVRFLGKPETRIETDVGILPASLRDGQVEAVLGWGRRMGVVRAGFGRYSIDGLHIDMGNPHWVLPVEDHGPLLPLAAEYGAGLQSDRRFPEGVNVGFARLKSAKHIELVVYERGAGLTEACGTGAGAAALALVEEPGADVQVDLPGGTLVIRLPQDIGQPLRMRGPAEEVFRGQL